MNKTKQTAQDILAGACISINGPNPWDIEINDERLYLRVLTGGSLALGESYMDGWWDVKELDEFFARILTADLDKRVKPSFGMVIEFLVAKVVNQQKKSRAFEIGVKHYDIGNDLYEAMLDKRMTYTCGYWENLEIRSENLDLAQEAKLDLVCRKIGLKGGDRVLDIGSGWGSFAKFAAERYGAEVIGITVSKEQVAIGNNICRGVPSEIKLMDYRDIAKQFGDKSFDHVVSLGMFEHVGSKNYRTYMKVVHSALKDNGLFLLHTIGTDKGDSGVDPWIEKYIFPNSMLPSVAQIGKSFEGLFVMEDWHNFSSNYYPTLMAWFSRFDSAWPRLKKKYDDRFYRMWKYYLMVSAGGFKSRKNQLWQIVLSKNGVAGGYKSIRPM